MTELSNKELDNIDEVMNDIMEKRLLLNTPIQPTKRPKGVINKILPTMIITRCVKTQFQRLITALICY